MRKTKRGENPETSTGIKVVENIRLVPESKLKDPPKMNMPGKYGYAEAQPSMDV